MRRKTDLQLRQEVADRIRRARIAAKYDNASELARLLGVTPQRLNSWELGDALPNTPRLWNMLVEALDVTCDYILRGRMDGLSRDTYAALIKLERSDVDS